MFLGIDYTTTVDGSVIKFVQCEECSHEYVYEMVRKISGRAFSVLGTHNRDAAYRSQRQAETGLEKSLRESCDPVPCPQCGHYQQSMVERIRRIRLKWMKKVALYLTALAPLLAILTISTIMVDFKHLSPSARFAIAGSVIGVNVGLIPLLLIVRVLLNRAHEPNAQQVQERIELGRSRAISKTEYLQNIQGRVQW